MSSRARIAAVLVGTLVLGMVVGALGFSVYQRHRFRDALSLARPTLFTARLERVIGPVEESRRQQIDEVLRRADERMRANRIARDRERRAQLDSIRAALHPLLTDGQRRRLERYLERHKRWMKRGPSPHRGGRRH